MKSGGVPGLTVGLKTPSWWEWINVSSRSKTRIFLFTAPKVWDKCKQETLEWAFICFFIMCLWLFPLLLVALQYELQHGKKKRRLLDGWHDPDKTTAVRPLEAAEVSIPGSAASQVELKRSLFSKSRRCHTQMEQKTQQGSLCCSGFNPLIKS